MAVNRHVTASAHQGGNFTAGKLPTITLKDLRIFPLRCCRTKKERIVDDFTFDFKRDGRNEGELLLELRIYSALLVHEYHTTLPTRASCSWSQVRVKNHYAS